MRIGRRTAFATAAVMLGCRRSGASLLCFAAASTAEAMRDACAGYVPTVRLSFAGSGDLARQIENGAPADVFLSADEAKMDALVTKGLVNAGDRHDLLTNRLVVVVAEGAAKLQSASELAALKRIALGDPKTVPAGAYARTWLESEGLWAEVQKKVVPTADVRAALAAVDAGTVDAAVVYRTDLVAAKHAALAFEPAKQPRIVYPIAALPHGGDAAKKLVEHLRSPAARAVFARYGFTPA